MEAAAPAEEPVGAAPVEEPETAVPAVAFAGEAGAAPAEGIDFADEEAALAARSAGLDEEEPADGEAVDEGAAGASDALFDGRSEEEMVSLFAKMLDEEPVQSLRRVVEAVKIAFYKAHRAEVEAQRRALSKPAATKRSSCLLPMRRNFGSKTCSRSTAAAATSSSRRSTPRRKPT